MSDLVLMPDVELLVIEFLLAQAEIVELVDNRIYSKLPSDKTFPAVRIKRYNSLEVTRPASCLEHHFLQIDTWGGTKNLAFDIGRKICAAMRARMPGVHEEGVVSGVDAVVKDTDDDPDVTTQQGKARPHCRVEAEVWAHPAPGAVVGS